MNGVTSCRMPLRGKTGLRGFVRMVLGVSGTRNAGHYDRGYVKTLGNAKDAEGATERRAVTLR